MTIERRADLLLPAVLDDLAGGSDLGYVDEVLVTTARIRQRRVAASIQRWLPMLDSAGASVLGPRVPWRGLAVALLVIALLAAGLVLVAGAIRKQQLAPPFGLAQTGLVAFESKGDIVATLPDGTGLRTLISGPGVQWGLVWSHRGDRFAYWSAPTAKEGTDLQFARASLWVADSDGSGQHQVSRDAGTGVSDFFPDVSWSPDDRQLAYARDGVLSVVNADGTNQHSIGADGHTRDLPAWSPDGTLIAYTGQPLGDGFNFKSLYVIRPDGSDDRPLIQPEGGYEIGSNSGASWSPDSRSILVHVGGGDLPNSIEIAHRDAAGGWAPGRKLETVAPGPVQDYLPAWSTTGIRFAFLQDVAGATDGSDVVMVANADGSDPRLLASMHVALSTPCWSPDDRFVRAVTLDGTLVLLPLDGSRPVDIGTIDPGTTGFHVTAGCYMQRRAP
jgi:Tol biopolymer transport system component